MYIFIPGLHYIEAWLTQHSLPTSAIEVKKLYNSFSVPFQTRVNVWHNSKQWEVGNLQVRGGQSSKNQLFSSKSAIRTPIPTQSPCCCLEYRCDAQNQCINLMTVSQYVKTLRVVKRKVRRSWALKTLLNLCSSTCVWDN